MLKGCEKFDLFLLFSYAMEKKMLPLSAQTALSKWHKDKSIFWIRIQSNHKTKMFSSPKTHFSDYCCQDNTIFTNNDQNQILSIIEIYSFYNCSVSDKVHSQKSRH